MSAFRKLIITGLGTGYLPVAPGSWGSAAVCLIFIGVAFVSGRQVCLTGTMVVVAIASVAGCVALGRFAEDAFGCKDPPECSLDEWGGQAVALCMLPIASSTMGWLIIAGVSFLAFRFFDIIKPPPARQLENLPHGRGIAADDIAAGLYANIVAQVVLRFWLLR